MPLRLKDSGAVFQRCIRETLENCPGSIPYIGDILVYGKMQKEHDRNLEQVLRALHSKNFWLQLSKCLFWRVSLPFLGHVLLGTELKLGPATVAAIADAPTPRNAQQLSSFLSLVNFYIDFIPDLATKVEPMHALGRKGAVFEWSADCQKAFDGVKQAITADMALALYEPNAPTYLSTDASGVGFQPFFPKSRGAGKSLWPAPATHFSRPSEITVLLSRRLLPVSGGREI